MAILTLLLLYY